jgi:Ca2+-binding EF-hand superfamily protein
MHQEQFSLYSIEELSEMFMVMDTYGNGTVSLAELKQALHESDTQMDDVTIEKLFKGIDVDNSGV